MNKAQAPWNVVWPPQGPQCQGQFGHATQAQLAHCSTSPRMPGVSGSPRGHPVVAPPAPVASMAPGGSGAFPSSRRRLCVEGMASPVGSFAPSGVAEISGRTSSAAGFEVPRVAPEVLKPRWESTGVRVVGASLSTEAASGHTRETSAASGSIQLAIAPSGGSIAASAGDAQVGALRNEIEGLRAELDALKTLLDEGFRDLESTANFRTPETQKHSSSGHPPPPSNQPIFRRSMARICRRSLRIRGVPLFSLGHPWSSVVNAEGKLALSLFEPRFVEAAGKLLPPSGDARFGYAESYPPRERTAGVLANIEDHRWIEQGHEEFVAGYGSDPQVQVLANHGGRFRILKAWGEHRDGIDLYYAHIQLLAERDLQRGPGADAMRYWAEEVSKGSSPAGDSRASQVKSGTHLLAMVPAPVFESPESWRIIGQVPTGVRVIAMDVPRVVEGCLAAGRTGKFWLSATDLLSASLGK
eukprot:s1175_g6.t1